MSPLGDRSVNSNEREEMPDESSKFACAGCGRKHVWKKELAGKRGKCKCGQVMIVPAEPEPEQIEDDLYALADDMESAGRKAAASAPPVIAPSISSAIAPQPALAGAAPPSSAGKVSRSGVPLAYQRAPTAREVERNSSKTLMDMKRDVYVPIALIFAGAALYVGYYAFRYHLGVPGMFAISLGLVIMTILETALLMGFALTVAGPLGVSFGGIGTAFLKLAALAVFCDGATTCVDGIVGRYSGGFGNSALGFGAIGFPVALGIYWFLLIYLFSMHPSDSWFVVGVLVAFYWIVRVVLVLLLLRLLFSIGGASTSSISLPSMGGAAPTSGNPIDQEVDDLNERHRLREGKKFAADTARTIEGQYVNDWYAAGSPNVWFGVELDINQKAEATEMIVELPTDATSRTKCFDIAKKYSAAYSVGYSPLSEKDPSSKYLIVHLP